MGLDVCLAQSTANWETFADREEIDQSDSTDLHTWSNKQDTCLEWKINLFTLWKSFTCYYTLSQSFVTVAGVRPAGNVDSSQTEGEARVEVWQGAYWVSSSNTEREVNLTNENKRGLEEWECTAGGTEIRKKIWADKVKVLRGVWENRNCELTKIKRTKAGQTVSLWDVVQGGKLGREDNNWGEIYQMCQKNTHIFQTNIKNNVTKK